MRTTTTLLRASSCALLGMLAACGGSGSLALSGSSGFNADAAGAYFVSPTGSDADPGTLAHPFQTLARAQAQMQVSGHPKITYLRAGTYVNTALTLAAADDGEIWAYNPPDGIGSAVLDGGATSPTTGGNPITIDGASAVTIYGLAIQNFQQWGIAIHGGEADSNGGFATAAASVSNVMLVDKMISGGYTTINQLFAGGGIWIEGDCRDVTIAGNLIQNQYASAIRVVPTTVALDPTNSLYTFTGLTIRNNAIFNVNLHAGDNGAIYLEDQLGTSTDVSIADNFIRDYQQDPGAQLNVTPLARDVAIYLDSGTSNATVSGNVIAATDHADLFTGGVGGTVALFNGGGHSNTWQGNLVDLGTSALVVPVAYDDDDDSATGNLIEQNIWIAKWSGDQLSSAFGTGPAAYFYSDNVAAGHFPTVTNNLYYNYGGGTILTSSNKSSGGDAAPVTGVNPSISGVTYALASSSAVYGPPLTFPPITGDWGPPGYTIPATGTAPSSP